MTPHEHLHVVSPEGPPPPKKPAYQRGGLEYLEQDHAQHPGVHRTIYFSLGHPSGKTDRLFKAYLLKHAPPGMVIGDWVIAYHQRHNLGVHICKSPVRKARAAAISPGPGTAYDSRG